MNASAETTNNGSEIAIIGLSGRFPGTKNVEEFWQNLQNGVESISFFTDEELLAAGIDSSVLSNPNYVKARAVLEDVELFDAGFFGFSPREAEITDPQHRLFLECAYTALENAGYDSETYSGAIGVYAGASLSGYLLNIYTNEDIIRSVDRQQLAIGSDKDFLTTRVSYKLNLEGSSYTVQTACSTSLVAVHLACQSLLNGESDLALAGGVSISATRCSGYFYQQGGILSPDGHCRTFDAQAQGTVSGEGVGVVVLKRLEDAIADRDTISAVIKGSAINNDGSFKVSYTAPRIDSQAKVIRTAQLIAEVDPETITYIEAHGTATSLGDPIEIAALTQAFRASTHKQSFCAIGSVKTNIGHLDAAAGVAGLIKTVLALKHKQIPPSLHFKQPNPEIDFANSPFYVNTSLTQWQTNGCPRRAGVSSFGIGGTNAHVILEEAPVGELGELGRNYQILVLSAKTSTALETVTANLARHLEQHPDLNLADVAYSLQVGRKAFDYRRIVVCQHLDDAVEALNFPESHSFTDRHKPCHRSVVFMFSPQGAQYVEMGRELYQTEPIFREQVDRCCELLQPHLKLDLRHILYPNATEIEAATQQLTQTAITQPALFVIEYALSQLWMAWGVYPEAAIGHSIGEYVAATLAGVFCLEDALALVATRGRLMQQLPAGAMLSVQLGETQLQSLLDPDISLAGSNSPLSSVVSGSIEAIAQLQQQLIAKGIGCRRLHTSHAFHSQMMEPIVEPFTEQLRQIKLNPPKIPFVSNVSGTWITPAAATDPNYWAKHLRQPVRFSAGITELLDRDRILLEVGPGRTLTAFVKQQTNEILTLTSLRHPQEQQSDVAFLLNTLGRLWLAGVKVNWSSFHADEKCNRLPLPTYPFERQRYWIEPQKQATVQQFQPRPTASQLLPSLVEAAQIQARAGIPQLDTQTYLAQKDCLDRSVAQASPEAIASVPPAFTAPISERELDKLDISDWFYIPSWKRSLLAQPFQSTIQASRSGCWLVFLDECGLGEKIVQRLTLAGQEAIAIGSGKQFQRQDDRFYTINPKQQHDYITLLTELHSLNKFPHTIVHLWSVTPDTDPDDYQQQIEDLGFYSLLFLAQAIGEQNLTEAIKIALVSNNMQEVTGSEVLCPEKALILGSCQVMPLEYPNITCHSLDVVVPEPESGQEAQLIDLLLAELTSQTSEAAIAYRGRNRWVQTFEPVRLDSSVESNPRLRQGGVYLITGGLGGVGLALAEYLAQTVQAKLILLGRSPFPHRDMWEEWLSTHESHDTISTKIKKLQALEAMGAEVMVVSADVADWEQMSAALQQANRQFGQIHGVIHAAAVPGGGMMQLKTPEAVASALAAKVTGTRVLDRLFQNTQLDFFVLCSSLSAFVGTSGMVDYTAANAFLDRFAHYRSQHGTFTTSINWDRWNDLGMAVAVAARHQEITGKKLTAGMTLTEGIEVFRRILHHSTVPQAIVSTQDFLTLLQSKKSHKSWEEQLAQLSQSKHTHSRPNLENDYVTPSNEVERSLAEIWQQLLGIEKVGIHDNFFELGGDSLFATQLVSQLCQTFQIELSYKSFFDCPTIAQLAEAIAQKLAQQTEPTHNQIKPQNRDGNSFPLSFAQQRLWFLDQLQPGNIAFNISQPMRLRGSLNLTALEQSFNELVKRHEVLRTTFATVRGQPVQVIQPPADLALPIVDLQQLPVDSREVELLRLAHQEAQQPFNLAADPLLRVTLVRLAATDWALLLTMHHIVCDGWSIGAIAREIGVLYQAFSRAQPSPLPALPIQYADFAVWQHQELSAQLTPQLAYWKQQLAGIPVLKLPTDFPRPATQTFTGARRSLALPKALSEQLKALDRRQGITLFMTLLAAFQTLLWWYTGQEDIVVGTDIANRNQPETQELIGFFTNQLVLRSDLSGNPTFQELLERVRQITLDAYAHQDLPFDKLVNALNPKRELNRAPLFQVKIILQNTPITPFELSSLAISPLKIQKQTTQLDLILDLEETDRGIMVTLEYNTDLFASTTIVRMLEHFEVLLSQVAERSTVRLQELREILNKKQQKQGDRHKFQQVKRQVIHATTETHNE